MRRRSVRLTGWRRLFAISLTLTAIVLALALVTLTAQSSQTGIKPLAQAGPTKVSVGPGLSHYGQVPAAVTRQTGNVALRNPVIGLRSSLAISPAVAMAILLLIGIASLTMTQRFRTVTRTARSKPSRALGTWVDGIQIRDRITAWIKSRRGLPAGLMSVMGIGTSWRGAGLPAASST
jgi:hypothetical protein